MSKRLSSRLPSLLPSPASRLRAFQGLKTSIGSSATPTTQQLRPQPRHSYTTAVRHLQHSARNGSAPKTSPPFAFAFDIDGVLLRSSQPIPGASAALNYLHSQKIPFIFLTNGGGKHESDRVAELVSKLDVPLSVENFVQSHTPFQELVEGVNDGEGLKDKCILVTGGDGDKCRKVAERYGFKNVITPGDIVAAQPNIWPFKSPAPPPPGSTRPLPLPISPSTPSQSLKIDAVFVFNDPRDWALDTQLILDCLLSSNGILGTLSPKNGDSSLPNNGWQQDGQPPLFFSNPDLFWATDYFQSRLGQGGFQAALEGVWSATTDGAKLSRTVIGKPHRLTYRYAERVLGRYREALVGEGDGPLERVYMLGDNPESDIRGANEFESERGAEWVSVLVKTGVWREGTEPKYVPKATAADVFEGVKWALEREGWGAGMKR